MSLQYVGKSDGMSLRQKVKHQQDEIKDLKSHVRTLLIGLP